MNALGDIYVNEEVLELACDAYVRALETDPDGNIGRGIRAAKVLTSRGALEETRRLIARIEEVYGGGIGDDDKKDLLQLQARLALADGAGEEEARVLEQIVQLDPLDGQALLLLAQYHRRIREVEKAVFYFERAANLEGFEGDAKVGQAQLLVDQGKYAEALPLLRRAQALEPRDNVQEYLEQIERLAQTRVGS